MQPADRKQHQRAQHSHRPRTLNTNMNRVRRFSGEGAVTKMLAYPSPSAPAMARPSAADCGTKVCAWNRRGCCASCRLACVRTGPCGNHEHHQHARHQHAHNTSTRITPAPATPQQYQNNITPPAHNTGTNKQQQQRTLPRPRLAVSATVERSVFSLAASRNVTTARACSLRAHDHAHYHGVQTCGVYSHAHEHP